MTNISTLNVKLSASWGPNDPEVESVWMLLKDAVGKLNDLKVKDEADFFVDRIYEKLREARTHFMTITADDFSTRPSSEQEAIYSSLYSSLWSAYKDRLTKFTCSIGYDTGAIFAGDKQYEVQMQSFVKRYPEVGLGVKRQTDLQKEIWQDALRDNRNAHEHDGDLRKKLDLPSLNSPEIAKDMFINVCRVIESTSIALLSYKLPEIWNVVDVNPTATVFDRLPRYKVDTVFRTRPVDN